MMEMLQKIKKYIKFKGKYRNCTIAKNVEIIDSDLKNYVNVAHDASIINCVIDRYSSIGRYSKLQDCMIGKYCSISWDVTIGAKEHPLSTISTHSFPYNKLFHFVDTTELIPQKTTTIGNDVWIGCGVIIKSGLKIGNGAVIGAGAVVTKDVEPYAIVAGCPAKVIRYRFQPEIIEQLEKIKWWDFETEILKKNIDLWKQPLTEEIMEKLLSERKNIL